VGGGPREERKMNARLRSAESGRPRRSRPLARSPTPRIGVSRVAARPRPRQRPRGAEARGRSGGRGRAAPRPRDYSRRRRLKRGPARSARRPWWRAAGRGGCLGGGRRTAQRSCH
jgi:hypothetical protein